MPQETERLPKLLVLNCATGDEENPPDYINSNKIQSDGIEDAFDPYQHNELLVE